jgi:hypothetical protein
MLGGDLFGQAVFHKGFTAVPCFSFGFLVSVGHFVLLRRFGWRGFFFSGRCCMHAGTIFHEGGFGCAMQRLASFTDRFRFAVASRWCGLRKDKG